MADSFGCSRRQFKHERLPAYTAVNDHYNRINTAFLRELQRKHDVENAVFLIDYAQHLAAALRRTGLRFPCFSYLKSRL